MHLIALSGGVDSSAALLLSKEKYGTSLLGATLALAAPGSHDADADAKNIADAAAVCETAGVNHTAVYAHDEFRAAVMDYFAREYLSGRTPNPCVVCNREIKFGLLADFAAQNGCDRVITGHYAKLENMNGYITIRKAADITKDQSYVLAMLTQDQLRRAEFPLGNYTKPEIREMAGAAGLKNAQRRDSQDVCFIPDGDYVSFITRHTGEIPVPGDYIDENGTVLGKHKGQWCYTIGQRKGLGISMGRHVFVLAKDAVTNRVTLGDEAPLFQKTVRITGVHAPSDPAWIANDVKCRAKLRYAHREADAVFHRTSEHDGVIEFAEPQRAPSPGQFAVLYSEDCVIGAGVIA
ncbi:MAG: tRNA 2-thiouridine(34) synthase MnmA [Clostridia bacterium]|nr:tRNA 2-thiouridine(34) synthase MnmA [Clostridia bacterium]